MRLILKTEFQEISQKEALYKISIFCVFSNNTHQMRRPHRTSCPIRKIKIN